MTARKSKAGKKKPAKKKTARTPRSPAVRRARRPPADRPDRGGRPAIEWTEQAAADVHKMARAGNTVGDMAAILEVSKRSLENALQKNPDISEAYRRGCAERRDVLRTAQLRLALRGNATMLIWLGKQDLGQREPPRMVEVSGAGGEPIEIEGDLSAVLKQRVLEFLRSRGKKLDEEDEES